MAAIREADRADIWRGVEIGHERPFEHHRIVPGEDAERGDLNLRQVRADSDTQPIIFRALEAEFARDDELIPIADSVDAEDLFKRGGEGTRARRHRRIDLF